MSANQSFPKDVVVSVHNSSMMGVFDDLDAFMSSRINKVRISWTRLVEGNWSPPHISIQPPALPRQGTTRDLFTLLHELTVKSTIIGRYLPLPNEIRGSIDGNQATQLPNKTHSCSTQEGNITEVLRNQINLAARAEVV